MPKYKLIQHKIITEVYHVIVEAKTEDEAYEKADSLDSEWDHVDTLHEWLEPEILDEIRPSKEEK